MPCPCCGPKTRMRRMRRSSVPCSSAMRSFSSGFDISYGLDANPYDARRAIPLGRIDTNSGSRSVCHVGQDGILRAGCEPAQACADCQSARRLTTCPTSQTTLILGCPFGVIDDEHFHRALLGIQLESELLLHG